MIALLTLGSKDIYIYITFPRNFYGAHLLAGGWNWIIIIVTAAVGSLIIPQLEKCAIHNRFNL